MIEYLLRFVVPVICLNTKLVSCNPVVGTKYGQVEGISVPIHTGQVIDTFMAVPYARPPIDELRFMPPKEPIPWIETLLAHEPGNACVQLLLTGVFLTHPGWDKFDEDCLTINIYTPQTNGSELLPVLVFIHGGDFINGANFMHPGYFQAAHGVVVVMVNYRLSILGFATTEDEVLPGNLGLLDQAQALRFIQENIAAFGGDPTSVTISGESAGSASVGLHLVSPVSSGLFHRAILQSGTELDYWVLQTPEEEPSNYLRQVAETVGCTTNNSSAMIECLRTINAQRLVSTNFNCTEGYDCGFFRPTIDGTFLTDYPSSLRNRGEFNKVPEIIGINEDEGSMWILDFFQYFILPANGLNRTDFDMLIEEQLSLVAPSWPDPARLNDAIEAVRYNYADWPYFEDPYRNRYMYTKMYGDCYFGHSADLQAKSHSDHAPVYFYVYDYTFENSEIPDYYGTFHSAELPFTMGGPYIYLEENEAAYNHSLIEERNNNTIEKTETDFAVSDFMMKLWTNFAKYSNPTPEPEGPTEDVQITWPNFTPSNLTYAYLTDQPDIRIDYRQDDFAFWAYYLPYITHGETFEDPQASLIRQSTSVSRTQCEWIKEMTRD